MEEYQYIVLLFVAVFFVCSCTLYIHIKIKEKAGFIFELRFTMKPRKIKKLIKIGRSYYALMPSVLLQLLSINPDNDEMKITLEGDKIILEKVKK